VVPAGAATFKYGSTRDWVRALTVVLASGGCAFGERMLGATGLTGDGYLMAAEAGATIDARGAVRRAVWQGAAPGAAPAC